MKASFVCTKKDLTAAFRSMKPSLLKNKKSAMNAMCEITVYTGKIKLVVPGITLFINCISTEGSCKASIKYLYFKQIIQECKQQKIKITIEPKCLRWSETQSTNMVLTTFFETDDILRSIDTTMNPSPLEMLRDVDKDTFEELDFNNLAGEMRQSVLTIERNIKKAWEILKIYGVTKDELFELIERKANKSAKTMKQAEDVIEGYLETVQTKLESNELVFFDEDDVVAALHIHLNEQVKEAKIFREFPVEPLVPLKLTGAYFKSLSQQILNLEDYYQKDSKGDYHLINQEANLINMDIFRSLKQGDRSGDAYQRIYEPKYVDLVMIENYSTTIPDELIFPEIIMEFKYEISKTRKENFEIRKGIKQRKNDFNSIEKDIKTVYQYSMTHKGKTAYFIIVDEDAVFSKQVLESHYSRKAGNHTLFNANSKVIFLKFSQ